MTPHASYICVCTVRLNQTQSSPSTKIFNPFLKQPNFAIVALSQLYCKSVWSKSPARQPLSIFHWRLQAFSMEALAVRLKTSHAFPSFSSPPFTLSLIYAHFSMKRLISNITLVLALVSKVTTWTYTFRRSVE